MRRISTALLLVMVLSAVSLLPVRATTVYTALITVTNPTPSAVAPAIVEIDVTGVGLAALESNLLRVDIEDALAVDTIWEARSDATKWRMLAASVPASSSSTYTLDVDDATAVPDVGAWAYATTPEIASTLQHPAAATGMSITARAYVGPSPKPSPTLLATSTSTEQYPGSNRMAETQGAVCMSYIAPQTPAVRCSDDLGVTWGLEYGLAVTLPDVPVQISIAGKNGLLHMAFATHDTSVDPNVQRYYYSRGVVSGNEVAWDNATLIDTQIIAASEGPIPVSGISITLAGTASDVPSILYTYYSVSGANRSYLKRMTSTASNAWVAPTTTPAVVISNFVVGWKVDNVPTTFAAPNADTVAVFRPVLYNPDAVGTRSYSAAIAFSNLRTLASSSTGAVVEHFSCAGMDSTTTVACLYQTEDGAVNFATHTLGGAWSAATALTAAIPGIVYPAITLVPAVASSTFFPDVTAALGAVWVLTWTQDDGSIYQAWRDSAGVASSSYQLIATGTAQGGATSPQRISNAARFSLGLNSLSGSVYGYAMPPVRQAVHTKRGMYGLFIEPDGQITGTIIHNAGTTTATFTPTPGIHAIEVEFRSGVDVRILVDTIVEATVATAGITVASTTNTLMTTFGMMADSVFFETPTNTPRTEWFGIWNESGGVYTSTDTFTGTQVATVQEFFPATIPGVGVITGPLQPPALSIASPSTADTTLDVFGGIPVQPSGNIYAEPTACMILVQPICQAAAAGGVPLDFLSPTFTILMMIVLSLLFARVGPTAFATATGGLAGLFLGSFLFTIPIWIPLIGIIPWLTVGAMTFNRQAGAT